MTHDFRGFSWKLTFVECNAGWMPCLHGGGVEHTIPLSLSPQDIRNSEKKFHDLEGRIEPEISFESFKNIVTGALLTSMKYGR